MEILLNMSIIKILKVILIMIFKEEKEFDYSKLNHDEVIKHIAKFTSSIWQVTRDLV